MNLSTVGATSQILWRCSLAGEIPQGSGSTFANTNWKRDPPAGKLEWRSRWQPRPHDTNEWNLDRTELPDRNEITEIAGDGCSFSIKEAVCSGWVMSESVSAQTQEWAAMTGTVFLGKQGRAWPLKCLQCSWIPAQTMHTVAAVGSEEGKFRNRGTNATWEFGSGTFLLQQHHPDPQCHTSICRTKGKITDGHRWSHVM